jgi:hypothetical protein
MIGPKKNLAIKSALDDCFLWEGETPWMQSVRFEYERDRLHCWDNQKIFRACQLLHCTVYELCALVGQFHKIAVDTHIKNNKWPMYMTIPINKLLRFRTGLRTPDIQDMLSARLIARAEKEEEQAA